MEPENIHYLDPLTVSGNKGRIRSGRNLFPETPAETCGRVQSKVQLLPRISYSNEATQTTLHNNTASPWCEGVLC